LAHRRKTWREKLADREGYPKVLELEEGFPCYRALHKMGAEAGDRVVLVNPSEIVARMREVPNGKVTTLKEICQDLGREHRVDACCTLTSGIHVMTAANAAAESVAQGEDLGIPYWRTLKIGGYLNQKYPGGVEAQSRLLEEEGHIVKGKGNAARVMGFEGSLFTF
jgi:alkylated DNA nucleotide flippase Atl1